MRFADEVSENQTRISVPLLPNVPDKSKMYSGNTRLHHGVLTRPREIAGRCYIRHPFRQGATRDSFARTSLDRVGDDGRISLIEYIVCRLEKMNNERVYCSPYMHYGSIRSVVARFTILSGTRRLSSHDGTEIVLGEHRYRRRWFPQDPSFSIDSSSKTTIGSRKVWWRHVAK